MSASTDSTDYQGCCTCIHIVLIGNGVILSLLQCFSRNSIFYLYFWCQCFSSIRLIFESGYRDILKGRFLLCGIGCNSGFCSHSFLFFRLRCLFRFHRLFCLSGRFCLLCLIRQSFHNNQSGFLCLFLYISIVLLLRRFLFLSGFFFLHGIFQLPDALFIADGILEDKLLILHADHQYAGDFFLDALFPVQTCCFLLRKCLLFLSFLLLLGFF